MTERLAAYAPTEELLGRLKEWFEKKGITAHYTLRAAEAAQCPAAVVLMPRFDLTEAEKVSAMRDGGCGVVVATRAEQYEETRSYFSGTGVIVLKFPIDAEVFKQSVALVLDAGARFRAVKDENESLKIKLDDMKLIDRAKCALIEYLHMTEKEAHRFIEKQAMNKRVSRREVALGILKTYES